VTAITVTRYDGRDGTDARYPLRYVRWRNLGVYEVTRADRVDMCACPVYCWVRSGPVRLLWSRRVLNTAPGVQVLSRSTFVTSALPEQRDTRVGLRLDRGTATVTWNTRLLDYQLRNPDIARITRCSVTHSHL
jgi:hypothetical protein